MGRLPARPSRQSIPVAAGLSPVALKYTGALWKANGPGIDAFHTNNFVVSTPIKYPYKNFSDRADYIVNDKLRVYGRVSLTRTPVQVTGNPTGSPIYMSDRGADYNMASYAGDATYILSAVDSPQLPWRLSQSSATRLTSPPISTPLVLGRRFPGQRLLQPVFADPSIPKLIPRMSVNQ